MSHMEDTRESSTAQASTAMEAKQAQRFVDHVFSRCDRETPAGKAFAARLSRADNPATEHHCWELLLSWGVDIEKRWLSRSWALICAAIGRTRTGQDGDLPLGAALALCYEERSEGSENSPARARLRRLLACHNNDELCQVLRPLLQLIESRQPGRLSYGQLLDQLDSFSRNPQRIKARWAQSFYQRLNAQDTEDKESAA